MAFTGTMASGVSGGLREAFDAIRQEKARQKELSLASELRDREYAFRDNQAMLAEQRALRGEQLERDKLSFAKERESTDLDMAKKKFQSELIVANMRSGMAELEDIEQKISAIEEIKKKNGGKGFDSELKLLNDRKAGIMKQIDFSKASLLKLQLDMNPQFANEMASLQETQSIPESDVDTTGLSDIEKTEKNLAVPEKPYVAPSEKDISEHLSKNNSPAKRAINWLSSIPITDENAIKDLDEKFQRRKDQGFLGFLAGDMLERSGLIDKPKPKEKPLNENTINANNYLDSVLIEHPNMWAEKGTEDYEKLKKVLMKQGKTPFDLRYEAMMKYGDKLGGY